jgi:AcrR family transcriptional regulator
VAQARKPSVRGAVREPIIAAAAALFRERGFAGTSMQDIADAIGLSRPALYYHFKNKDEILASLVEEITLHAMRETSRIAAASEAGPAETLRAMVRAHALWILSHASHFAVLSRDEHHLPARVQAVQQKGKRELLDTFGKLIRDGAASGHFRAVDAAVTALSIFGMCNWTVAWFKPGGRLSEEQVAEAIANLAVAMVQRPATGAAVAGDPLAWLAVLKDDVAQLEQRLRSPDNKRR